MNQVAWSYGQIPVVAKLPDEVVDSATFAALLLLLSRRHRRTFHTCTLGRHTARHLSITISMSPHTCMRLW